MGGKARKREQHARDAAVKQKTRSIGTIAGFLVAATVVVVGIVFANQGKPAASASFQQPTTFEELTRLAPAQIETVDLARMNLLCASGLPGSESMNLDGCLTTLDRFATTVRTETEKHIGMYARNPGRFRNIEGFYRMQMLVTVLKQDLGVDYSSERTNHEAAEVFFADSKDIFLNGLHAPPHRGTCASLPVLVVAVGQKLGYPVNLVATRNHLFARWESSDGRERFNIECTNGGMTSHDDGYYLTGAFAWNGHDFSKEGFLDSMTPQQNMAAFLDLRGLCLRMNGRFSEARQAYQLAVALKPESVVFADKYRNAIQEEQSGQLISSR